jgi:multiple sugar transport system substrate-binding protein
MRLSLFQGILLGVFGLGAVIGIFVFSTYSGSKTSSGSVGPVVIWGTLPSAPIDSTLLSLAKTDPSLKSASYIQKDPTTLANDLTAAIATNSGPDLVLAPQENLYSLESFLLPISSKTLPESVFNDSFIQGANIFAAPTGYYGIPFLVDPLVLFYNRTILSSSGIAEPPATWESLVGLVPEVTLLTPTQQVTRSLIALGTYNNVSDARGILSALFLQTNVPISGYSQNQTLSADLGTEAENGIPPGEAVLNFYTQFADPSKLSYTWNNSLADSQESFLANNVALYLGYGSEAQFLTSANPNLDFAVAPLPQPATAQTKTTYGLIYALMIPRGTRNPSGAYAVAATLSGSAEQTAASAATGLAPTNLNALATLPADPNLAVSYREALYTSGWLSPAPTDTDTVFSDMINSVITGQSSPPAALTTAEESLTALLQQ